jgi:hypothetical protein
MAGIQTAIDSDNSAAVGWTARMASRSASPISFRLLKGFAMRQRTTRSAPPAVFHVAGVQNVLADVASRPQPGVEDHFHLLEYSPGDMFPETFLILFNSSYPLPQRQLWHNVQPPAEIWSNVISTLRGGRLTLPQWTTKSEQRVSGTGPHMPPTSATSTPGYEATPSPVSNPFSLPLPPGFELAASGTHVKLDSKL